MKYRYCIILSVMMTLLTGCHSKQTVSDLHAEQSSSIFTENSVIGNNVAAMPKAVVYKTNGDWSNHVFINLDSKGQNIVSYPDPSDVSIASTPLPVADGWLLDRRGGIGLNSAFLDYTYSDYSSLDRVPSHSELLSHIIKDAKVTRCEVLPVSLNYILADTSRINQYLPK